YERAKGAAGQTLRQLPVVGESAYGAAKRMKDSLKQLVSPISIFETLGLKYGGPIDGHDIRALEKAMRDASALHGPVVIHVVTDKGHGYAPAVDDDVDKFHGVSSFDPDSGAFGAKPAAWTDVFGAALLEAAEVDDRIVAITAAMASSTGLLPFAARFPQRFFDVGIAEQHAVTFAAGLAMQGMRPVVCIYSTFLQRAFDQVACDVALHKLPVTFVLDRAGITGDDGASHHGMLDLAYLRLVPGMTVSAPSSPDDLRDLLVTALAHDGPFAIRYPRGTAPQAAGGKPRVVPIGRMSVLREGNDLALLAIGKMVGVAEAAAETLAAEGVACTVVDARFVKPLDQDIAALVASHTGAVTIEDGTAVGGFGDAVLEALAAARVAVPVTRLGLPDRFIEHGAQQLLLHKYGLDAEGLAAAGRELLRANRPSVLAG
ncbi:MAG: 1-deoxy-D-xylulose-5-phosphate synthase, partial [Pseudonocardiales bacterium]|nr:1-deoxy-D-xylulose-5-phosphate synthase [Pseudonocardiales bacterium]